ncbi:MAG: hypothetical protein QF583_05010 [Rhodospirillales bacterium]|jgi:hypothetical protein|nr:hypothetical protein [Rhodospirillales bacterium]HJN22969.1 hypothetical protein [Rhodospirillales bacterium]|tara:strand:+ start:777 stop:1202 length:426 start_codon:yes stop_codon:yes gene_type:complete
MLRKRVQEKAWKDFVHWCAKRGLNAIPANPWTVAAYARWCEPRRRYPVIAKGVKVIARMHLLNCLHSPDSHPTVRRTLRQIEVRAESKGLRTDLFRVEDFRKNAAAGEASAKIESGSPNRRPPRALRSTPKLVIRRPGGGA